MNVIAITNHSTVLKDDEIALVLPALQKQLDNEFATEWGCSAKLLLSSRDTVPAEAWTMDILDDSDQIGALGYHNLTQNDHGYPSGKIFAKTDIENNLSWTVTLSHELCLSGDTEIPLLNGTKVKIYELVNKKEFWVYSVDKDGNIQAGRGHSARKTGTNVEIIEVHLDNGEIIKCTPDHLFMTRDGNYCKAENLKEMTSLMPLYREKRILDPQKKRKGMYDYEMVYNPSTNSWLYTHRIVAKHCPTNFVRHHKDFNRFNNSPDNIEIVGWKEHIQIHNKQQAENFKNGLYNGKKHKISTDGKRILSENGRKSFLKYNGSQKHKSDMDKYWTEERRKECGKRLGKYGSSTANLERLKILHSDPIYIEKVYKTNGKRISEYNKLPSTIAHKKKIFNTPERKEFQTIFGKYVSNHIKKHTKLNIISSTCEYCNGEPTPTWKAFLLKKESSFKNHKVIKIVRTGEKRDVYDFTVDDYHNFAISEGVFVHNCEMLVNPTINLVTMVGYGRKLRIISYEVADAVESDALGYKIDGVLVSDFVNRSWFEPNGNGPYDYCRHLSRPLQIAPGGYIGVLDLSVFGKVEWKQVYADNMYKGESKHKYSVRRQKRFSNLIIA